MTAEMAEAWKAVPTTDQVLGALRGAAVED